MGDEKTDETTRDGDGQPSFDAEADVSDEERAEIDEERKRRLDPENRPDDAEIDNSDANLPTVEEFNRASADEETEGSVGTSDPSEKFRENPPSDDEVKEIEEERKRRLDPDHRPDNVEVDNTGRTFKDGGFVDEADES